MPEVAMPRFLLNPRARSGSVHRGLFEAEEYAAVDAFCRAQPDFRASPLHHMRGLAATLKLGGILLKDESARLGLNSFKILGVSYAVDRLSRGGRLAKDSVLVCASEGNHGRAVAHVAAEHKLEAKVYVAGNTSRARTEAIEREGAQVIFVDGDYDDAVRQAARDAAAYGWQLISDTSWSGYEEIPRLIMAGYTRMMAEAEKQWMPAPPPDVVLVQAGVGGLAGAVISWLCWAYGKKRPFVVVCEAATAACFLESTRAGTPVAIHGPFDTIMAGLRCGEVSPAAWTVLSATADAFLSIDDEQSASAMRMLAHPRNNDPVVTAGASGACGLAALLALERDEALRPLREESGLNEKSRVLVINSEGATDPELYARITGKGELGEANK